MVWESLFGAALQSANENTGKIVVCFFGDGATNEGVFNVAVNMASIWNLQIFSLIALTTVWYLTAGHQEMTNVEHIHQRNCCYGPWNVHRRRYNVLDVYEGFKKAVDSCSWWQWPCLD